MLARQVLPSVLSLWPDSHHNVHLFDAAMATEQTGNSGCNGERDGSCYAWPDNIFFDFMPDGIFCVNLLWLSFTNIGFSYLAEALWDLCLLAGTKAQNIFLEAEVAA